MEKPEIALIAAIEETTRAIGKDNKLLWKLRGDLPRFKKMTMGYPVIMGRKTFMSLPGMKPLEGRKNIVVSGTLPPTEGIVIFKSFRAALAIACEENPEKIFIIGGEKIFKEALPEADILHLTLVWDPTTLDADCYFPEYGEFTKVVYYEEHQDHSPQFSYIGLEKPRH